MTYVENIPTKKKKKEEDPRFFSEKKDSGGKKCDQTKAREGQKKALSVTTTQFFIIKKRVGSTQPLFVSVGKKVAQKAVERNLIKRRVRSIFSDLKKNNEQYSVVVKPSARMVSFQELKDDVVNAFRRR